VEDFPMRKCAFTTSNGDCFDLWVGEESKGRNERKVGRIFVIISHCLHDLIWLPAYLEPLPVYSITIYSKCGKPVLGAPHLSKIIRLENIGRNDHSFAHWMARAPEYINAQGDDIALFMKDDMSSSNIHQASDGWKSFPDLVRVASRVGFACGLLPSKYENGTFSAYHSTPQLLTFQNYAYFHNADRYDPEANASSHIYDPKAPNDFKSKFLNMGEWLRAVGGYERIPSNVTQVCYGGVFATRLLRIFRHPPRLWLEIEKSLSVGDNIEEGHFAERSWAPLLAVPVTAEEQKLLWQYSSSIMEWYGAYMGTLTRRLARA
jgi:hypothetical protein